MKIKKALNKQYSLKHILILFVCFMLIGYSAGFAKGVDTTTTLMVNSAASLLDIKLTPHAKSFLAAYGPRIAGLILEQRDIDKLLGGKSGVSNLNDSLIKQDMIKWGDEYALNISNERD